MYEGLVGFAQIYYGRIVFCIGRPCEQYDIFLPLQSPAAKSEYVVRLNVLELNLALGIISSHQEKVMLLYIREN